MADLFFFTPPRPYRLRGRTDLPYAIVPKATWLGRDDGFYETITSLPDVLERLIVTGLVKKFHAFIETRSVEQFSQKLVTAPGSHSHTHYHVCITSSHLTCSSNTISNVTAECLAFRLHIQWVLGSNLCPETGSCLRFFMDSLSSLK
jgi:hypothetical protein